MGAVIVGSYDPFGDSSGVSLWPLDGDFTDVSGAHDATGSAGISFVSGPFSQAADFADASQNIDFGTITIGTDFAISAWVYNKGNLKLSNIFGTTAALGSRHHHFALYYGKLRLEDADLSGGAIWTPDGSVPENAWSHLLATGDANGVALYVNAKKLASTSEALSSYSMQRVANGDPVSIDQVRLFSRRLTDDEVLSLYYEQIVAPQRSARSMKYAIRTAYAGRSRKISYNITNRWADASAECPYALRRSRAAVLSAPYSLGEETIVTRIVRG